MAGKRSFATRQRRQCCQKFKQFRFKLQFVFRASKLKSDSELLEFLPSLLTKHSQQTPSLRLRQRIAGVADVNAQNREVRRVAGEQRVVGHQHRLGAAVEGDARRVVQRYVVARLTLNTSELNAAGRQERNLVRESQSNVKLAVVGEG